MVFMALDHNRDFICDIPFEPEDIDKTWGFHFLVRRKMSDKTCLCYSSTWISEIANPD